jgi:hypothetical protein
VKVRFVALKLLWISVHFALGLIIWQVCEDFLSTLMLLQPKVAFHYWIL